MLSARRASSWRNVPGSTVRYLTATMKFALIPLIVVILVNFGGFLHRFRRSVQGKGFGF